MSQNGLWYPAFCKGEILNPPGPLIYILSLIYKKRRYRKEFFLQHPVGGPKKEERILGSFDISSAEVLDSI